MRSAAVGLLSFFVLFLVCVVMAPLRCGAADFQPISAEEMKINEAPGYPGAPVVVLYHEETDDDLLHYHEVYMRMKVLTEAGREQADVQLPYNRRSFQISDIKGRTVHADGSIVNFEGKPFDKTIVKGKDIRYNVKAFTLPDVQVGSIIEYRYSLRYDDNTLYAPQWTLQNGFFQRRVHYRFKPYKKDWIDAHGVSNNGVKWTFMTPGKTEPVEKRDVIEYDAKDMPPFIEEPFMPPPEMFKFTIRFYYDSNRKMEEFWADEGKYWSKDVNHFIDDKSALRNELAKIVAPGDTPEQKVRKIYAYVAGYTNLTYSPDRSSQELLALGLTPKYTVEKVIRAKTGDREDLTRLFVGLVREADIAAFVMRVTARDDAFFLPQYLDWSQLDTEIAIVRIGNEEVYLDPGTRFCPYGLMHWTATGARGVRQSATGKGTEIADTPQPSYKDAQTQRIARFRLTNDGSIEGNVEVAFYGQEALSRRVNGAKTDVEGRTKLLEDEVKGWLPDTAEVKMTTNPEWEDGEKPLKAVFRVTSPIVTAAGRRRLLPMQVFHFSRPAVLPHSTRKFAVYFDFPYSGVDRLHVELPPNMTAESVPPSEQTKLGYAYYATQYQQAGSELETIRQVGIGSNVIGVENYADLKGFFEKVKAGDDQQVVLTGVPNAQGK